MDFKDLSPELKEKALACKSPKDLLELAKNEGYELSEEQLESVSGGSWFGCDDYVCTDYCARLNWGYC